MNPAASTTPHRVSVGVFDSGFGGLTVLRELLSLIPDAHFIYLGDTARLPYGAKSRTTVARYAVEAARFLVQRGAELLVIACNTATALALDDIQAAVPVPVIGVIKPGADAARAACTRRSVVTTEAPPPSVISTEAKRSGETPASSPDQPRNPHILVLATTATVDSHAYRDTCARLSLHASEKACPLLVPLVEEGWTDHPVTRDVLHIYLAEALAPGTEAVLLGCTHYPLLAPAIREVLAALGSNAPVIDSAHATAAAVQHQLGHSPRAAAPSTFECFATDSVEKFARLGSLFLGRPMPPVTLLDLGG